METIEFTGTIVKVQTMATDLSIRLTLDLPEYMTMAMAQIAECKRQGAELKIAATPVFPKAEEKKKGRFDE